MKIQTDIPHDCGGEAEVETEMYQTPMGREDSPPHAGCKYWVQEGDVATCNRCGRVGRVEADGESAWVDWGEDVEPIGEDG